MRSNVFVQKSLRQCFLYALSSDNDRDDRPGEIFETNISRHRRAKLCSPFLIGFSLFSRETKKKQIEEWRDGEPFVRR